jgi:hypothetical protein
MTHIDHPEFLLPSYAAGTLPERERRAVEEHLAGCAVCRADLAFWRDAGAAVLAEDKTLPVPPPGLLNATLARARAGRINPLARAWTLLRAQTLVVRRDIWTASALVMSIGYVVALIGGVGRGGGIIEALAPLLAASGVAMIYGPDNDPSLELALATPTSPRQVLLARLVLVYGYDLFLALAATVGLLIFVPPALLGEIIMNWLGPMTFLSALALVLSLCTSTGNAVTVAFILWLIRGLERDVVKSAPAFVDPWNLTQPLMHAYEQLWSNPALLWGLSALLVVAAVWLAGRRELFPVRRA